MFIPIPMPKLSKYNISFWQNGIAFSGNSIFFHGYVTTFYIS